jgi:hypothetical protein
MAVTVEPFSLTTGLRSAPVPWSVVNPVPAFNTVGSWSVTCPAVPAVQALAVFDTDGTLVPFGVWIDWNGVWSFTGKAEAATVDRTIDQDSGALIETITFSGPDMTSVLAERIAYPDPALAWSEQTIASVTAAGAAETVIKGLIAANCVTAGDSARNYPLLTVAPDLGRGGTCTWTTATPDPSDDTAPAVTVSDSLMDIWRAITAQLATPIGITVDLVGTQLVADCYVPRDLSGHAVFSAELGNLSDASLNVINPAANAILTQSAVDGAPFTETAGSGSGPWRRIEQFDDESSSTAAADVTAAQAQALSDGDTQTTLSATAVDLPRLRFGSDGVGITGYRLGDRVAVDLYDDLTYTDIISAVTLTADATQQPYSETVVPSIGTTPDGDTSISAALAQQLTAIERQIRRS